MPSCNPIIRAVLVVPILCASAYSGPSAAQLPLATHPHPSSDAVDTARQEARALAEKARRAGAVDTTSPVLQSIQVSADAVDAQTLNPSASAVIKMTDDLSGVAKYVVVFRSPSGRQRVVRTVVPPVPERKLSSAITIGALPFADTPFTKFAEPGTWNADLFYAYDGNGNFVGYSENELKALGSSSIQVKNDGGYDNVPPGLSAGVISTPHVRLSKPPKGTPTGTMPYVQAQLSLTDRGRGVVSGVYSAYVTFCANWCAQSFALGGLVTRTGKAAETLTVGAQLPPDQEAGSYEIFAVELNDVAGNERDYMSQAFGGGDDLGLLFPQGLAVVLAP